MNGFAPPRFELEQHDKTPFPLAGAHQATACRGCHPVDAGLAARVPAAVRAKLAREHRPQEISLAVLRPKTAAEACSACHRDPHEGQFSRADRERATAAAATRPIRSRSRASITSESRFPLTGAHRTAPCAGCHKREPIRAGGPMAIRYNPISMACRSCHADLHQGQFAARGSPSGGRRDAKDCSFCHPTASFGKTVFTHDDRRFTTFALAGKHAALSCDACHRPVQLAADVRDGPLSTAAANLRGVPRRFSSRRLQGVRALKRAASVVVALLAASAARFGEAAPRRARAVAPASPSAATNCAACHVETGWTQIRFDHERTGFPLEEAHARLGCRACHQRDFRARVPDSCSGCHRDRHAGELGLHCEGCHDENSWRNTLFGPDTHRFTSFPLTGKHAVIPCRECHGDLRDMTFSRAPVPCVGCHRVDYEAARSRSVDHVAAGFDTACQTCHSTWRFSPARFEAHDLCFLVSTGPHRAIPCAQCHTTVTGLALSGSCATGTSRCVGCHAHECARSDQQHQNVMGYSCADRKCYECHQRSVP